MTTQEKLEEAISLYGLNDIVTIMLSQQIDKEIVQEQKEIYKKYQGEM